MTAYHLLLTIYSQSWTIYIHITLDRKHQEYIVPIKRLATAQKALAYIGIKIWESLDQNLKVQPFYIFKKKCKLHFLNQY